jgi:hypothetical protein
LAFQFHHFNPFGEIEEFLFYFIQTYIGFSVINTLPLIQPITLYIQTYGNYALVDEHIRTHIVQNNLQNREPLFPISTWCMFERVNEDLALCNNSLESWHRTWGSYFNNKPKFSRFIKRMKKEDEYWEQKVTDFRNSPAGGIRGHGMSRKTKYLQLDQDIALIVSHVNDRLPLLYLKALSHRIHFEPV